jgi:hypothetical protein
MNDVGEILYGSHDRGRAERRGDIVSEQRKSPREYPLLESVLTQQGLLLKGIYTNRDAAQIFGVSVRTIQDWVRNADLVSRNLPGRGRFLSEDLENFLRNSSRFEAGRTESVDQ